MGIGSGIVADGRLFFGQRGLSGEIGHCPVIADGPACGCGRSGCLETVASTMALARAAEQAMAAGEASLLSECATIDAAAITQAALAGDALRMRRLAGAGEHLGRGISYLLNILNPEMVVLAGPLRRGRRDTARAAASVGGAPRDSARRCRDCALDAERARDLLGRC